MFTCSALKHERRLGQQLFQVAATIGMAMKYGVDWVLPTWSCSSCFGLLAPQTTFPLHIDAVMAPSDDGVFDVRLISNKHVIDLRGNFHHERYFHHCRELVRSHLEPSDVLIARVRRQYASILCDGRVCVVVARCRASDSHQVGEFYRDAISKARSITTFAIMSDDQQWWNEQLSGARTLFLPRNDILGNFILGTLGQETIVAGSELGWWISWLNRHAGKQVFVLNPVP